MKLKKTTNESATLFTEFFSEHKLTFVKIYEFARTQNVKGQLNRGKNKNADNHIKKNPT